MTISKYHITLEELRNMNGEPVWVETGGFKAWGIVGVDKDGIYVNSKTADGYNIRWRINSERAIRCYRYKPKENTNESRKNCPMRHKNGNCLVAGGFCTSVNDPICEALHNAYDCGYRAAALREQDERENPKEEQK